MTLRGCSDGNCIIQRPEGMRTNGGCDCWRALRQAGDLDFALRIREALVAAQAARALLREAAAQADSAVAKGEVLAEEAEDLLKRIKAVLNAS
jgi:hypothetical protein